MGIQQIISAGSCLPKLVVTNNDLSKFLDTNDEWISTCSGIKQRHIAIVLFVAFGAGLSSGAVLFKW